MSLLQLLTLRVSHCSQHMTQNTTRKTTTFFRLAFYRNLPLTLSTIFQLTPGLRITERSLSGRRIAQETEHSNIAHHARAKA